MEQIPLELLTERRASSSSTPSHVESHFWNENPSNYDREGFYGSRKDKPKLVATSSDDQTPEWVGWTVTGASPALSRLFSHGRGFCWWLSLRKSHTIRNDAVPGGYRISTAPNSQGSSPVDLLMHPNTTAACAAGVVVVHFSNGDHK